jgi:predicted DCC family thiol-disulfide oxidoreductase YuxK
MAQRETDADLPAAAPPADIVFFDGVCGFCNQMVQWLADRDRDGVFYYAPLQGEVAAAARARHPEFPQDIDTAVYLRRDPDGRERIWLRSSAVLRICGRLPWPWRAAAALLVVPAFLRDPIYRLVAAVRYRIFGKVEACRLPDPEQAARMLS